MCNLAGYIGNRRAAPVLIEMMEKQSGLAGGYYTGIVTVHEGKLHCAKVMGDMDKLLSETNAMDLPGNFGLIHSRSRSGGDVRWAHPFIGNSGKFAIVANGAKVKYDPVCDDNGAAAFLWEQGVCFDTESPDGEKLKSHPQLPNGNRIHDTELICQLTEYYRNAEHISAARAMEKAVLQVPMEAVFLGLHTDEHNAISYAKYNMPLTVARTEDEVFLSSISLAIPTDRDFLSMDEVPTNSSGTITLEESNIHRFRSVLPTGTMEPKIVRDGYDIVLKMLKEEGPCTIGQLNNGVRGLWADKVDLRYPLVYSILQDLQNAGKLQIVKEPMPGVTPELTATLFKLALK